jgi:hypothetical protein
MGWKAKAIALLLGLAFFGAGAWPLGIICLLSLALSLRARRKPRQGKPAPRGRLHSRTLLASVLLVLSGVALASGGMLSPLVFFAGGAIALTWPVWVKFLPLAELAPVGDSILLRSKYLPVFWCSIAELKPGVEPFPMAASALSGTLLAFTDTGRTYLAVTCRALRRNGAEARLLAELRAASSAGRAGAFLLPMDARAAADLLRLELSPLKSGGEFAVPVASTSGLLVLECRGGCVKKAAAFTVEGTADAPAFPGSPHELDSQPLTWEIFEAIGRRTRWPDPDRYSGLLDSMLATRGEPFAERLEQLESSGDQVTIRSLTGENVVATRPQLRAIVSIYS